MNLNKNHHAVTPIIGTVLLLAMAISLFAVLNVIVFTYPHEPKSPAVNLIGAIDNGDIVVNHYGGDSLDPETQVIITIGSAHTVKNLSDFSFDENGDNKLSFGETLVYTPTEALTNRHVVVSFVDIESNSIILTAVLQRGGT